MPAPVVIFPILTEAGKAAAISADNVGLHLTIGYIGFGPAQYDPTGNELAMFNEVKRVPATGVMRPAPNQMRLAGAWAEYAGVSEIGEIGFWTTDGVLVAIWSRATGGPLGYKTEGVDFVLFADIVFEGIPQGSIQIVINPDVSEALSALVIHETAPDAHLQYLLRADYVIGHQLMTADVTGTANALILTLPDESEIQSYARGQQITFIATLNNTGPVTVNVDEVGSVAVTKTGAVPLQAGDIQAGAAYTLVHDGTRFQLFGGAGGGGASVARYPFIATAGQTSFACSYTPGFAFVHQNGRLLPETDYTATDGTTVVLSTPAMLADVVEIVAVRTITMVDTYTRSEADARFLLRSESRKLSPAGAVIYVASESAPDGWLKANGALVSRTAYADLFAVIGTTYGAGDGSTTFRLPDLRGEFIRGWDDGRGIDPSRGLGSQQAPMVQAHKHVMPVGERQASGADSGYTPPFGRTDTPGKPGLGKNDTDNYWFHTNDGSNYDGVVNPAGVIGSETRPRNVALLAVIRY